MCYAYKKQRRMICLLHKSPNLIDREKNSSGENSLHLNGIQVKKSSYCIYAHKNTESGFYVI